MPSHNTQAGEAKLTPFLLFLVAITVLGPLQFGYHLSELNAPSEVIRCLEANSKKGFMEYFKKKKPQGFLPECIEMTASQFGLVQSIYTIGGFAGAVRAGPMSSQRGRLFPMRIAAPFFIVGSLLEALAPNIALLAAGRLLSGVGAGIVMVVGPVYISEIAPRSVKGTLGALTQIACNVGILLTQVLGYFLSHGAMWRVVLGTATLVAALHALGLAVMVESPAWYASQGRVAEANIAQAKINSSRTPDSEGGAATEREALISPTSTPSSGRDSIKATVGIGEIFRHPDHQKAIIAVVVVMVSQQLCGINAVMMYSADFLSEVLPTGNKLITVAVGALNVVVTAACSPLADKLGRKTSLLLSIFGMGCNSALLAIGLMNNIAALTAVATLLFVASFGLGLGPIPFILASELVGPEAVGAAQSWALAASWASTFVVAQFFPILNHALGEGKTFIVFAVLAAVFFTFITWWVPETKGKANADEVWGRERRED